MRIEDSPYSNLTGFNTSSALSRATLEKLKHLGPSADLDKALNEFDLSFLDLLSSVSAPETDATEATREANRQASQRAELDKATKAAQETRASHKLSLVGRATQSTPSEDPVTEVSREMTLLKDELSDMDIQYLKQAVIPGLPILMGSVPVNTVFPTTPEQEISYRGFEVSSPLADLIEKGYKTGRPIRVELDPQSALVLKIRDGRVSAEFVSADKSAAFVMQQELDDLKSRMAARNLPVGNLEYKYQDPNSSGRQSSQQAEDESNDSQSSASSP